MINEIALCAMCGKEFKKTHSTHRYCSRKCVAKAQKIAKERFNKKVREEKEEKERRRVNRAIDNADIRKNYAEYQKQQTLELIRKGEL